MHNFELRGYPNRPQNTHLSQVQLLENRDGSRSLYKANYLVLNEESVVVLDFLRQLSNNPHPNLLIPEAINGELGQPLVEIYPYIDESNLRSEQLVIGRGIKEGRLDEADILDMMLQLTSALAYIHGLGYVHRDVKARNIFIKVVDDKLKLTLFDYNSLGEPYFEVEGLDRSGPETPPELREGNVMVDARFDVYALGYILFDLTHDIYEDRKLIPPLDPNHPLFSVMRKAKSPLIDRYADAAQMHEELLAIVA